MTHTLWLGIEGGGTKTRIAIAKEDTTILFKEIGEYSSPLYIQPDKYVNQITKTLTHLCETIQKIGGTVTCIGVAGPMDLDLVKNLLIHFFGNVPILRFNEGSIALAYHGIDSGCVIIAGTGASCYFVTPNGTCVMSGGLGPQFGDEGSGYWIGRQAIRWCLTAEQLGTKQSELLSALLKYFCISRPYEIFALAKSKGFVFPPQVAGFAKEVIRLAQLSEKTCINILHEAAQHLGLLVKDVLTRTPHSPPIPLVLSGGIFHAEKLIVEPLIDFLEQNNIKVKIYPPIVEPLPGLFHAIKKHFTRTGAASVSGHLF